MTMEKQEDMAFLQDGYTDNLQKKLKDLHGAWKRCFDKKLAAKAPVFKKNRTDVIQSVSAPAAVEPESEI